MPADMTRYGPNWPQFAAQIKTNRALGRCECQGQCGLHRPNPYPRRCSELQGSPARWHRGRVLLTVAHLCTCNPPCQNPAHVIAACQRCHLRIDAQLHAQHRTLRFHPRIFTWTPKSDKNCARRLFQ
jgi:hypothetical protein